MPNPTDVSPIVVTGARPSGAANNVMAMWLMVDLALQEPAQVIIAVPAFGAVDGHEIVVQLGPGGTIKPEFAQAQIDALRRLCQEW